MNPTKTAMYFSLGAVQTKFGSTDVSSETNNGITLSTVSEAYKKNSPDKPILRPDMVADEVIFALVASPESVTPVRPS
jgi:hypothetical protein